MSKKVPFYKQMDMMDCGPTCLRMIAGFYGKFYSAQYLRERAHITREGVSLGGISQAAESIGMHSLGVSVTYDSLATEVPLPCIAHWRQRHFVVIYKVTKKKVYVADPAHGMISYSKEKFMEGWQSGKSFQADDEGMLLLVEPTPEFYKSEEDTSDAPKKLGFSFLFPYFKPYTKIIFQLGLGLLIGSLLQLVFPFLTQSVVDYGINYQDINFVYLILLAQLTLFVSQTAVQLIRGWLILHMTSRINISLISDFLIKLMRLSIAFFDAKNVGDIMQRINDHGRIQSFLSTTTLSVLFSLVNVIIFGAILLFFSSTIFLIFFAGSAVYVAWTLIFLKKRAELDYKQFDQSSGNQSSLIQLMNGMQEIKLNNSERRRRWEWELIQFKLFKISIKTLSLSQMQNTGGSFINEMKNIFISFVAAKSVIDGQMTLGMMLSVSYIIGQLGSPITSFVNFIRSAQDAKISLERLSEIHGRKDEELRHQEYVKELPKNSSLNIKNLSFQYGGSNSPMVLKGLNIAIPEGKVTAIVGASGSGKTTILKLLLKFYAPTIGKISSGSTNLEEMSTVFWRKNCGIVMQDGYIFSDSIARNITESASDGLIDKKKLLLAVQVANLEEFIESLPLGYNTRIGDSGMNLSGGQKQRILIARAVYKDPPFLFFDEATSSLDANNEKDIMHKLEQFYKEKTVVIVAHRLSTVKNADNILVLDRGRIIEEGNHEALVEKRGAYYTLVKNQLELGN